MKFGGPPKGGGGAPDPQDTPPPLDLPLRSSQEVHLEKLGRGPNAAFHRLGQARLQSVIRVDFKIRELPTAVLFAVPITTNGS